MNISEKFEQLFAYIEANGNTTKYKRIKFGLSLFLFVVSCLGIKSSVHSNPPTSKIIGTVIIIVIISTVYPLVNSIFKFIFKINPIDEKWEMVEELKNGNPLLKIVYIGMIITGLFIPFKVFQVEGFAYEDEQIRLYGKMIRVKIESIHSSGKSGTYAYFRFEHNGETIEEHLPPRNYKEGDYEYIEYSTKDPHIVRWWENE